MRLNKNTKVKKKKITSGSYTIVAGSSGELAISTDDLVLNKKTKKKRNN